jgi:hypothetical protein
MHFSHDWNFENVSWDGGVVEYSTNGVGGPWSDAGSLMTHNGYTGTISSAWDNPLMGRDAFVNDAFGYTATRLDLTSLQGEDVRFRFRIGTDSIADDYGWYLDDIRIYQCGSPIYLPVINK